MKTYKIGIIGYGGFGQFLHHWWSRQEGVEVRAISDRTFAGEESDGVAHYESWKDLIANSEIEIVSIATVPAFHVEMACEAMRAGKHVLLEKPIALDIQGAETVLQVQRETGKILMVDHMLRYNPIIKALVALSADKALGVLRHAEISNYAQDESLPADHWFWEKELSGGIFIEHGVHFFDIINALTDQKFSKVYGCSHKRNAGQEDQVSATVLYEDGLIASHYHSFSGPGFFERTTIRLIYDLAKVEIEGWIPMKGRIEVLVDENTKSKLHTVPGFMTEKEIPISDLVDVSRPEGWGSYSAEKRRGINIGGIEYDIDEMVSGSFEIQQTKSEVYGTCLQGILADLITKIENPHHKTAVSAEDAYESLKIAVLADKNVC